jgi:hypothetical protein
VYEAVNVSPWSRVVGVIATEIVLVRVTSGLSVCAVSEFAVQARTRMCVCVASVHVSVLVVPVVLVVHATCVPETVFLTVAAVPGSPQAGVLVMALVPDL